jgi:hypothetical protein
MSISRSSALFILVLFFTGSLAVAGGCTAAKGRQNPPVSPAIGVPSPTMPVGADDGSCASLGGDICTTGEECRGSWITASDSFSCCSQSCSGTVPAGTLTIEPFDMLVENDDLGPLV